MRLAFAMVGDNALQLSRSELPKKALESFTFSEFWWSKVTIF